MKECVPRIFACVNTRTFGITRLIPVQVSFIEYLIPKYRKKIYKSIITIDYLYRHLQTDYVDYNKA